MTPRPGHAYKGYTDDEKKAALQLAAKIGNAPAARQLTIGRESLRRWREEFPEFWSGLLVASDAPQRRQRAAENLEDLSDAYTEREFEALQRAEKLIKTADGKELAALMRAMGASRGLATAHARGYRGEDAQVIEHNINFEALERAAQAILARAPSPPPILVVENLADPAPPENP